MTTAERWLFVIKLAATLGCGLVAGIFFAFSAFVMSALGKLPASQGLAAMQSINIRVLNPVFLGVFMGTAAACAVLAVPSLTRWNQPGAALVLAGALLYIVGTLGVTIACNVPLNDALAIVKPSDSSSEAIWASYLINWTRWNHVRTMAALLAAALLTLSLCADNAKTTEPKPNESVRSEP